MNYRTTDLMNELKNISGEDGFKDFTEKHNDITIYDSLNDYLNDYLKLHPDVDITSVIKRSNIDRGYAYQILNGRKNHPGKYKLTVLCICMGMNLKDIQRALTISGSSVLYPKIPVDAALIVCINSGYNSALQINEFLCSNGLEPIE